jgi:thymidine phosphorylase
MNQVLGDTCGNALEMVEAVAFLQGTRQESRLLEVTRMLSAQMLCIGSLAPAMPEALAMVDAALHSGRAMERFSAMVTALGGPADFVKNTSSYLAAAPVVLPVPAPHGGWIAGMDTRAIGVAVIELGGGRRKSSDSIDPRVGFTQCVQKGQRIEAGDPLAMVHASNEDMAKRAVGAYQAAVHWSDTAVAPTPVMMEHIGA